MGGLCVFRSPANEWCFSPENSREKYVQKKSLDAIPTGVMFTPCHDLHGGTVVLFMVPAAGASGQSFERKDSGMASFTPESQEVQEHREKVEIRLLESRVRRRLREGRLHLHKSRSARDKWLLGRYWVSDRLGVMSILRNVDLLALAQQVHASTYDLRLVKRK
jgi:hypothetical protein